MTYDEKAADRNRRWYAALQADPKRRAAHRAKQRLYRASLSDEQRALLNTATQRWRAEQAADRAESSEKRTEHRQRVNERERARYRLHPEVRRADNRKRAAEVQVRLSALKVSKGCVDCGYNAAPEALHFDHVDPREKSFTISSVKTASAARMAAELAKCVVRCANCHAIRTARQQRERLSRSA